jgi:hypothetical protein
MLCAKAEALCRRLKHCVRVETNKAGTWATLKSFQVFAEQPHHTCAYLLSLSALLCPALLCYAMLCYAVLCYDVLCCAVLCYTLAQVFAERPRPTCEGYAFDADGGEPLSIAAPRVVPFEVDTPHEEWCYRGTEFSDGAAAAYRRGAPERGCTMEQCFDATRCAANASLFVAPEVPPSHDMARLPACAQREPNPLPRGPCCACALSLLRSPAGVLAVSTSLQVLARDAAHDGRRRSHARVPGAAHSRAQQSTAERSRAQQSTAEHSRAQQSTAEQSRAEHSRAQPPLLLGDAVPEDTSACSTR